MNAIIQKTERLHALDSLRAIMMLLGLVIHSAITYGEFDWGASWPLKDVNSTSITNDFLVGFIHAFRMQLFFVVSGFFGAMLFYERKPMAMIKNRVSRIVLPFIVFVILLSPLMAFSFTYTGLVFAGNPNALSESLATIAIPMIFIPSMTFHLWFLYYLILVLAVTILIAFGMRKTPGLARTILIVFNLLIRKPVIRVFVFALFTSLVYVVMGSSRVETSTSFIPDFATFIYYFFFFIVGWILFKSKHLLGSMKRLDWVCTILGTFLFLMYFLNIQSISYELKIISSSIIVWLLIFGFTGLFIRYAGNHSVRMRYISDASYWVYLIHLPLTGLIPGLIFHWDMPSTFKFLTVLSGTTVVCFVSYHYLVRASFIGEFLNGRKYTKSFADIKRNEEVKNVRPALG